MSSPNAEAAWSSLALRFAPDHPTAAGHFPGNPIIPGALLLAHVLRAIDSTIANVAPREIRQVKFLHPVRPGDRVTVRWRRLADGEQQFEMRLQGIDDPVLVGAVKAPTE